MLQWLYASVHASALSEVEMIPWKVVVACTLVSVLLTCPDMGELNALRHRAVLERSPALGERLNWLRGMRRLCYRSENPQALNSVSALGNEILRLPVVTSAIPSLKSCMYKRKKKTKSPDCIYTI